MAALIVARHGHQQLGRLEQDRGPVVIGQRPPAWRGCPGRLDRGGHLGVGGVAQVTEHVLVVRLHDGDPVAAAIRCLPPIVMVSSARSPASSLTLASSAARSALPGA